MKMRAFFLHVAHHRGDENPRPGFDNGRQPVGQTGRAANRLPAGRAQRVNPPLTAIFEEELVRKYGLFFSHVAHPRGDENSRPGFDNGRQPVGQTGRAANRLPEGRAQRVNPPLTAIFKEELVRKYGLFFCMLHFTLVRSGPLTLTLSPGERENVLTFGKTASAP